MTAKKRNFLVGLTVLVAGVIFAWMVLRFGVKSAGLFAPKQEPIEIDAPRVDGLSEGSAITYQGVVVGRITKLARNPTGDGVTISALLETDPPVPMNVNAEIVITSLIGGGASVSLQLPTDPVTGVNQRPKILGEGVNYPRLHAAYVGLKLNILPSEYGNTAASISRAAEALADAGQEIRERKLVEHFDLAVQNITEQATRAGEVLQSIQDVMGDPAVKTDLRQSIANARKATEDLKAFSATLPKLSEQASSVMTNANATILHTQDRVDEMSKQLTEGLAKASVLLDSVHSITEKIDKGQGTAGLIVNDPKLYQSLVDSTRQLNADLADLQRLEQQWEQEGMYIKLSK